MSFIWARVGPPLNRAIEVNISNLAAVPSIIYGLLGLALFVTFVGLQKSLLAGGLTLALLVLPIIIIASREAMRAVPVSIEQGAMALGATRWQAVSRQTFPAAIPGMLTGTILALSRAIGEAAPLIVVGGVAFGTQMPSVNPLDSNDTPLFAMPLQIFDWADRPQAAFQDLAAAGHHRAAGRAGDHELGRHLPAQQVQPTLVRRTRVSDSTATPDVPPTALAAADAGGQRVTTPRPRLPRSPRGRTRSCSGRPTWTSTTATRWP